jgi:hypothetical protein
MWERLKRMWDLRRGCRLAGVSDVPIQRGIGTPRVTYIGLNSALEALGEGP